ncbi:MAG: hypothetical protein WCK65_07235 [Rhodospirillaceae bacterium]
MAISDKERKANEIELVRKMAIKLRDDIADLERYRNQGCPKNFLKFCDIRNFHNAIQGLVFVMQEKYPGVANGLSANMGDWIVRAKMKALGLFVEISREFVSNPPLTLTGSLTARDVLANESKNFVEARSFFNKVLMEQALDDKTADQLDRTLVQIEETIAIIETLLSKSVNYLEEF